MRQDKAILASTEARMQRLQERLKEGEDEAARRELNYLSGLVAAYQALPQGRLAMRKARRA
jgi:hypothetical protein